MRPNLPGPYDPAIQSAPPGPPAALRAVAGNATGPEGTGPEGNDAPACARPGPDDGACPMLPACPDAARLCLQTSAAELQAMLNAMPGGVLLIGPHGRIRAANTAACSLMGGSEKAILGRPVEDFIPHHLRPSHVVHRQNYTLAPSPRAMSERRGLPMLALDGQQRTVSLMLTPLPSGAGQVVATLTDEDLNRSHEDALRLSADQLTALNEELAQFAYSASHDLRAPLATIAGLLELCLEDLDDGEEAECRYNIAQALEMSRSNIRKVEGVLTLARAGTAPEPRTELQLDEALAGIWDRLTGTETDAPGFVIDCVGSAHVRTEAQTLLSAVENLLNNACRFRDHRKTDNWVAVRITGRQDGLSLCVSDNGTGIADGEQLRVFEIFRRSAQSPGHGLGLALVAKHVRRLGGQISLVSSPDGTTMILSFDSMEVLA